MTQEEKLASLAEAGEADLASLAEAEEAELAELEAEELTKLAKEQLASKDDLPVSKMRKKKVNPIPRVYCGFDEEQSAILRRVLGANANALLRTFILNCWSGNYGSEIKWKIRMMGRAF